MFPTHPFNESTAHKRIRRPIPNDHCPWLELRQAHSSQVPVGMAQYSGISVTIGPLIIMNYGKP